MGRCLSFNTFHWECKWKTASPTSYPTSYPTSFPTSSPTSNPTHYPTQHPTNEPTSAPTSGTTLVLSAGAAQNQLEWIANPDCHPRSCPYWDCDMWCTCWTSDVDYEEYGCMDDGGGECKCM